MKKLQLHEDWAQVKEKLKESSPDLTDEDLAYTPGQEQELLQRLAVKMNRTEEQVKGWIESVSFTKGKAS